MERITLASIAPSGSYLRSLLDRKRMQVTPFNYDYDVSHVLARHSILGLCSLEMCTTDVHVGNIMWQAMSQLPPREPRDSERLHRRDSSHGSYHQRAIKLTFNSYSSTTISIVCLGGGGGGGSIWLLPIKESQTFASSSGRKNDPAAIRFFGCDVMTYCI